MKKGFWKAIVFVLTGVIIGLVGADKLGMGIKTAFKGSVTIKQKGRGNVLDAEVKPEIAAISPKAERIKERLERQKARAQKKIDKQHD